MLICPRCGANIPDGAVRCNACGEPLEQNSPDPSQDFRHNRYRPDPSAQDNFFFNLLNNTEDTTYEYDQQDIAQNKAFAVLSYIGILFLVPLLAAKNSRFARFHTNQGLILFIINVIAMTGLNIIRLALCFIPFIGLVFNVILNIVIVLFEVVILIYMIIGILNVVNNKAKELPIIGKFKLIKY